MKNVVLTFLMSFISFLYSHGENVALKTNLLYDGLISPNLGVEVRLASQWTIDISGNYNPFELSHGRMWKHWLLQPEIRRRTSAEIFSGGFLAGHLFGGEFNYSFGSRRRQGWAAGIGVGYGYTWRLGSRWGIEAEIAVGYARYTYKKYPCNSCGKVLASHDRNYFGPTKAALSVVYYFGGTKDVSKAVMTGSVITDASAGRMECPNFNFIFVEVPETGIRRMDLSGSANLKFRTHKTDIDPAYLDNTAELGKITSVIDSIRSKDNIEITGILIRGHASPEGSYSLNSRLAEKRTEAVKEYLMAEYGFPSRLFETNFEAENWKELREFVADGDLSDRDGILAIIDSSLAPDVREERIKSEYPAAYGQISSEIYPLLRRTDYRIDYVYFYKTEEKSALHDVNLAISSGDYGRAETILKTLPYSPEAIYAQGVIHALRGDYGEAVALLRKAGSEGVAQADNAIMQISDFQSTR